MIHICPGRNVHLLLHILALTGEYPRRSIDLLGHVRAFENLIQKLSRPQDLQSGDILLRNQRMIGLSGKGRLRTIRLTRPALALLSADELATYMHRTNDHHFSGQISHIERNHRVAEATALMLRSGVPGFLPSRDLKNYWEGERNKTRFTRIVGVWLSPDDTYAVYNCRDSALKWESDGEWRAQYTVERLARELQRKKYSSAALLMGRNPDKIVETIWRNYKRRNARQKLDQVYYRIHYIPLDENGRRLLRILGRPDWRERMLGLIFPPDIRVRFTRMDCDAAENDHYILNHCDGDIARLLRFHNGLSLERDMVGEIVCFDWQRDYVQSLLGGGYRVFPISMDAFIERFESE